MKPSIIAIFVILAASFSFASPELTCRSEAKSAAVESYKTCLEASAKSQVQPQQKSKISDSKIKKMIIAESLSAYPGPCPCPENTDRAGRRCGGRSAWSRAGGYETKCYPSDVTAAEVAEYRRKLNN